MMLMEIESFVLVAKVGGFSQAAPLIGIAQPSLSARIKSLEEEIGGVLLHRDTRPVSTTPLGEALLPYFELVLDTVRAAREEARNFEQPQLTLL